MKHLTTILAAVLCAVCLSGCRVEVKNKNQINTKRNIEPHIIEFTYKGHNYLLYEKSLNYYKESTGITHDPDCPCHKEGGEE